MVHRLPSFTPVATIVLVAIDFYLMGKKTLRHFSKYILYSIEERK